MLQHGAKRRVEGLAVLRHALRGEEMALVEQAGGDRHAKQIAGQQVLLDGGPFGRVGIGRIQCPLRSAFGDSEFGELFRCQALIDAASGQNLAEDTGGESPEMLAFEAEGGDMDLAAAFRRADRVLSDGVRGIADLVTQPGLVNLDLADVRSILTDGGEALLGLGEATAREGGVLTAVQRAIHSPLLTSADVDGARSWLLNVSAGPELKLRDVEAAAQLLESAAHPDADVAFGVVSDPSLAGRARVTVVATRFEPVVEEPRRPRNALVMLPTRP